MTKTDLSETNDWPHEVIKLAAIASGYKRERFANGGVAWTLDEDALLEALEKRIAKERQLAKAHLSLPAGLKTFGREP